MRRADVLLVMCAACTPATTRPAFGPYPEALHAIVNAPPARVTEEAKAWLAAPGAAVQHSSSVDAVLETAWYDPTDSAGAPVRGKVRLWAGPHVPRNSPPPGEA